jgi:hypothetical protein
VNRAGYISLTLFVLAFVAIVFVATWLTVPSGRAETHNLTDGSWKHRVGYPAKLFRVGLRERHEIAVTGHSTVLLVADLHALKMRVLTFYGGVAVVVVLLGVGLAVRASPY